MNQRIKQAAILTAFVGVAAPSAQAYACSATETQVYSSATTAWCVENSIVATYGAFPTAYFVYGDNVIGELVSLFDVPAQGVYTFEVSVPTGGAHTGSECCGTGVTVTGDAFYGSAYGATGFWGYLLSLHETINDFTGQVSSGWPTDFWADHISAFPNSMDWHVMETLGAKDNDANLQAAGVGQKARFYPGGDSVDARVPMFDSIFALPNYGFTGLSRVFGFVKHDGLSWDNLGVPNPDVKRTEYVMAYLSLGAGTPVTPIMQAAHVGDGTPDGVAGDAPYTVSEGNIDAIATAHCAIAAAGSQGIDVTSSRAALTSGNYAGVTAAGTCGAGCPSECGCKATTNRCVAPWLSDTVADAGGGGTPAASSSAAGSGGAGGNGGAAGSGGSAGGSSAGTPAKGSGCTCRAGGADSEDARVPALGALVAFVALALSRGCARRR